MTRHPGTAKPGWPTIVGLLVVLVGGGYLCTAPAPSSTSPPAFLPAATTAPVAPVPPHYVPASASDPGERVSAPAAEDPGNAGIAPRVDLHGGDEDDDHHHRRDDDRDESRQDSGRGDGNFGRNHHHLLTND
jgi:hypothetical protein